MIPVPDPQPTPLPVPDKSHVTFYLSLPASTDGLNDAVTAVTAPRRSTYRHFSSLADASRQFGASDAQIKPIAASIHSLGLQFATDPTHLFGRVTGSVHQWQQALGAPLDVQAATTSDPFIVFGLPARTPAALQPTGTDLLLRQAEVYDAGDDRRHATGGKGPAAAVSPAAPSGHSRRRPWPTNTGTPVSAGCSALTLRLRQTYTEQQIQTAYGVDELRAHGSGTPVITILDLGGGWQPADLELAGQCFGYSAPHVQQQQGDGVATAIANADPETSLDLQTAAAVAPTAEFRLVQTTDADGAMLDAFSRALSDPAGLPDVISLSYGGCAIEENAAAPQFTRVLNNVLAMAALAGVSTFVASGDTGSTTCGTSERGTTLALPAVSQFVTAVGGTRLALGKGNTRVAETVWNDSVYGEQAAGGGGLSRLLARPSYQDGIVPEDRRAVPDVSALADLVPGWPEVIGSVLVPVGGTSGSAPFVAAATALVIGSERAAGRPGIGLANGWFYQAASTTGTFFDVTTGNNDLARVGCCRAAVGYDMASGLGVPNWAVLPSTLPQPG